MTLKSRFPNLVVGQITRDSVKKALANGITADQVCAPEHHILGASLPMAVKIISYLITHAHPQMRKNVRPPAPLAIPAEPVLNASLLFQKPLLPVTVQDQIRLWELEKNRVKSQEGRYHVTQTQRRHIHTRGLTF